MLRALDAQPGDCDVPRDFDVSATQARFDLLGELLSEAYGHPLGGGTGPEQDTALFGTVSIPAELTRTRTKRTRIPLPLDVSVSNFGGLATCGPGYVAGVPSPARAPIHPQDRNRIEPALEELAYLVVPIEVLSTPYDGRLDWVRANDYDWYTRFFSWL